MPPDPLPLRAMRVARPTTDIETIVAFYADLVGLSRLGGFSGHAGYDGVFIGPDGGDWHLEFTRHDSGHPTPTPTDEDLLVLYLPPDHVDVLSERLVAAGHAAMDHPNPYWAGVGARTHVDPDGYLVVLCPGD